jgi:hypothetical protein
MPLFALFAEKTASVAELLARFQGLLDPAIRPPFPAGGICLVRPDGYVACSFHDADTIAGYLAALAK